MNEKVVVGMNSIPRVLFSQRSLVDPTNPYSGLLFESLSDHVSVMRFTWKNALFGKYDLVHLQWPEYILREERISMRLMNLALCYLWALRLRLARIPVVETVHNLRPHDHASLLERWPLASLRSLVTRNIYLNRSTENDLSKGTVILHGHYQSVIRRSLARSGVSEDSYFLFFGLIRPYKGMERLIDAFRQYRGSVEKLIIAGLPIDPEYGEELVRMASSDDRVVLDFRHIPEEELAALVSKSRGVVLPYEYMYNSGALIYSLSAGAPVLAPASPANSAIQEEVGHGWLLTFEDSVRAEDLDKLSTTKVREAATSQPHLAEREWASIGAKHLSLYRELAE